MSKQIGIKILGDYKHRIDPYARRQKILWVHDMFPYRDDGLCRCGCGKKLEGRRTSWASNSCSYAARMEHGIIAGDAGCVRIRLRQLQKGVCQECGEEHGEWHADHIIEVRHGGGGCTIDNYQTLCIPCHKAKTKKNHKSNSKKQLKLI